MNHTFYTRWWWCEESPQCLSNITTSDRMTFNTVLTYICGLIWLFLYIHAFYQNQNFSSNPRGLLQLHLSGSSKHLHFLLNYFLIKMWSIHCAVHLLVQQCWLPYNSYTVGCTAVHTLWGALLTRARWSPTRCQASTVAHFFQHRQLPVVSCPSKVYEPCWVPKTILPDEPITPEWWRFHIFRGDIVECSPQCQAHPTDTLEFPMFSLHLKVAEA